MKTEEADKAPSPWHPITDPVTLAIIGKMQEELGELQAALSRCIIQGIDGNEPVTGKANGDWVAEEVADVRAGLVLLDELFLFQQKAMSERIDKKLHHLTRWHDMIREKK